MEKQIVGDDNELNIVNEIGILMVVVRINIESIEDIKKRFSDEIENLKNFI